MAKKRTFKLAFCTLDRQTSISYGTLSYTFEYDASTTDNRKGRLWKETGPTATRKFSYDYIGRVARESVTIAGRTYYMNYTWDKNGNLTTLRYPNGRNVTYTYDLADRVFKVRGTKSSVTKTYFDSTYYLPFGPDTAMKLGNGIKVRKTFDRRYYTQQITNSTAGIFGRSYQYDHNGNITQLLDLVDSTKSYHTITYDGLDRLLTAFGDFRTDDLTFSYFKNGNRKTKKKSADSTTYNYTNNRLTSTTGAEAVTYGYNNNGSVTSTGPPTYVYDKLNRIVKITGITPTDTFAYDGENKRVYSNDNGTALVNLYDIFGNLISQYAPGSAFYTSDYVWANGEPRVKLDTLITGGFGPLAPPSNPEVQFWYHTDHLGTPQATTDSLREDRWKISTDPFGETVSEQEPNVNNLRFPGQYVDRGSALNYNWNRYYQPKIGRYYQTDPYWGFRFGGTYDYAEGNPTSIIDPFGLFGYRDFWRIYKTGQGKVVVDLAQVGLLEEFKNTRSVQKAASSFENPILARKVHQAKDLCGKGCDKGIRSGRFVAIDSTETDMTFESTALFSIGRSNFYRTSSCKLAADCATKHFSYSCTFSYSIRDWFRQPFNFRGIGPRREYGTPYPINASWNIIRSGGGNFR